MSRLQRPGRRVDVGQNTPPGRPYTTLNTVDPDDAAGGDRTSEKVNDTRRVTRIVRTELAAKNIQWMFVLAVQFDVRRPIRGACTVDLGTARLAKTGIHAIGKPEHCVAAVPPSTDDICHETGRTWQLPPASRHARYRSVSIRCKVGSTAHFAPGHGSTSAKSSAQ